MSESRPLFTWESLEGEYTSWVNLFALDISVFGATDEFAWVDNYGMCYLQDFGGGAMDIVDRAGNFVTVPWTPDWPLIDRQQSIGNKYIVVWDFPAALTVGVFRRGALIWSRLTTLDMPVLIGLRWLGMSPNGRYVVVIGRIWGALGDAVLLYEGRP